MAYAVKYVFTFQSVGGTTREIRILKDGYSGDPIRRALGRAPILKKQQNGPVHGTSLEMYAECHVDQEFIEFYTSDPKEYRVDLYAGNALLWQGWITPELYSEPDIAPPYDVQVIATDGVGELKLYDFAAQGMVSLRAMLTYLLGKTGLSTDVFLVSSLKAGSAGAGALLDMEASFDYLVGKTCYEALSYLLTTLHATITWWGGHWLLVRENNVTFTSGKVRYFNTAGNSALLANSVQELGSMYQDPAWPVGQLSTVIDPAKNKIVVQAPWHPVTALKNSDMTQDSNWSKIQVSYDSTKGAYWFPQNAITTGELYQAVAFGGLRVPMRMTLSGCGSSESGSGFFGQGNGWLGLVLRYVDGSNNVYYLGTDGDGNRRWEQATPGQAPVRAFKQDLLSVDVDRENADRIELDIPALAVGGAYPSGTLTVSIFGGAAWLFSAHLDVILNKGYQDILRIDNGARGEGDDTEVAFGRVTSDVAYYQAFIQGILLNDGALITAFSDANFTTGMDFLSFISRDYARSVALPRARVEGTVSLEASVQLPPLVFTKDGLDYWLETWSWNLYEDELQISARTLPTATLTVESETITEAGGTASTGSSAGGASSTPVPQVAPNYFEKDGTFVTGIKLKDEFDAVRVPGLRFGDGESDPDLYVDVVEDSGGNPQRVLRSPLPLITAGDQIVEGGEPGEDDGGLLRVLEDVYHDDVNVKRYASGNVGTSDLLAYDSVKGWYAAQLGLNLSMENGVLTVAGGGGGGTTYNSGTVEELNNGSGTVDRVWKPKVLADWINGFPPALASLGSLPACDLNTLVSNGLWLLVGENYVNNPLPTNYGFLRVTRNGAIVLQEAYSYSGARLFKRRFQYSGTNMEAWGEVGQDTTMRGILPSGNLNTVFGCGTYLLVDSNTYQNVPNDARVGFLRVSPVVSGTWVLQEFIAFNGGAYYKRKFRQTDVSPGAWEQISGGGEIINNYYTYEVTATPTITTDTNQFLAATGDTSDRTLDILTLLQTTGVCRLGPGEFYVDGLVMPDDSMLIGSGAATKLRLASGDNKFCVKLAKRCTIRDVYFVGGTSAPSFSSASGTRHAVMWQGNYTQSESSADQPQFGIVSGCRFINFTGSAILCSDTGTATSNHLEVSDCTIQSCWAGINVAYYSEFHKFTNIRTWSCYYGAINNGGNNMFVNCDFSTCKNAFLMDNAQSQSPNNSHGSCIGCVFNHTDSNTGVGIRILGCAYGFMFVGCQIFYSQTVIDSTDGVVFSACNYGHQNCNITVNGGGAVLFTGGMFGAAPTISVTNNSNVHFVNCYVRSTGAVVSN